ncbi:MAG TPA: hypothetical protein VEI82_11420, partial [Myxococcota bacterium]|nr:hypothetical protein [Myxococcota bacterium]
ARAQIVGIWGTVEPDAIEHWAAALQRGTAAIARIELPADEEIRPLPKAVHLSIPGLGMSERPARLIGSAGSVDPTLQGRALLVALTSDPPPAGASVLAQVELEGIVERGVFLPPSAVVWNEGQPLAFVATDPNHFVRRRLHLARSLAQGFLATQGVSAGERFVRTGAQQLLSSQLLGSAIEE